MVRKMKEALKLEVILVRKYRSVLKLIEEHKQNLYGVYFFQDMITDSYLFNKSIGSMLSTLVELQSQVKIFPDLKLTNWFSSKAYMATLPSKYNLPYTKTFLIPPSVDPTAQIWAYLQTLSHLSKVVIKKGYSYETMSVQKVKLPIPQHELQKGLKEINWIYNYDREIDMRLYEKGCDKVYIVQPWNRVVKNRENEYRYFFVQGKPVDFFSHGYGEKHSCVFTCPHTKPLQALAQDVFHNFVLPHCPYIPAVLRIDMSYTKDPLLQDDQSLVVKGEKIRYYVNEIEIQPSFFFDTEVDCGKDTVKFQKNVLQALIREIQTKGSLLPVGLEKER